MGVGVWGLSPKANGLFPWPSSPGQGNNKLLYDLCVSVVHSFLLLTADASSLEITHPMHYDLSKHGANVGVMEWWSIGVMIV